MDELEEIKRRLRNKKGMRTHNNKSNYINFLITRVLLAIIMFFGVLILSNYNKNIKMFVSNDVLKNNMSFTKIAGIYNKYFGNIIPIKEVGDESKTVFNEKINYSDIQNYVDGYSLEVTNNYLVPIINSGVVVFIGEKEDYGKTAIIQGIDEVEYWYGNMENINVGMYDYVSKGSLLGSTKGSTLYLVFQKNNEYLEYEEVSI